MIKKDILNQKEIQNDTMNIYSWKITDLDTIKMLYIQDVFISSIIIKFSFKMNGDQGDLSSLEILYGPIVKSLAIILANFENSNIKLRKFSIINSSNNISIIWDLLITNYKKNLSSVFLSLVGSLNLLGNPNNFI